MNSEPVSPSRRRARAQLNGRKARSEAVHAPARTVANKSPVEIEMIIRTSIPGGRRANQQAVEAIDQVGGVSQEHDPEE